MSMIRRTLAALALTGAAFLQFPMNTGSAGFSAAAQFRPGGLATPQAQQEEQAPISWRASVRMTGDSEGVITMTATMADGWHIYGMETPADGPQPTRFTFSTGKEWKTVGKMTVSAAPVKKLDKTFGTELAYWEGTVTFTQKFRITDPQTKQLKCSVRYMGCNDQTCLPPATKEMTLTIRPAGK